VSGITAIAWYKRATCSARRTAFIGEIGLRQLGRSLSGVAARIGREINPHILSAEEFTKRRKGRDRFLTRVLAAPKLFVVGSEIELEAMD